MAEVAEIVVKFIKFAILLFFLLLIPATLIVATPVVLVWPRKQESQASYGRTVLRRYGKVARAASFFSLLGGESVSE
ncbi:MAG: hypothetical protein WD069_08130 [Planctomycetales bacterium]